MSQNSNISPHRTFSIFINYRRADTSGHAGHLYALLSNKFPGQVFMDIDKIEPGQDFAEVITDTISKSTVLIVLIGKEWLSITDSAGQRRLDNPKDLLRVEVAAALSHDKRVIPVLVEGASMPRQEDLPPDLQRLARLNAIELSDSRWSGDVDRLCRVLEKEIPKPKGKRAVLIASIIASLIVFGIIGSFFVPSIGPNTTNGGGPRIEGSPNKDSNTNISSNTTISSDQPQYQAFVDLSKSKAEFVFPVKKDDTWSWNLKELKHADLEYNWQVEAQNDNVTYNIYIATYNDKKSPPGTGTLKELINNIATVRGVQFKSSEAGTWDRLEGYKPDTDTSTPGKLKIILEGELVKRVFSKQTPKATFYIKILGSERKSESVPIVYRD